MKQSISCFNCFKWYKIKNISCVLFVHSSHTLGVDRAHLSLKTRGKSVNKFTQSFIQCCTLSHYLLQLSFLYVH